MLGENWEYDKVKSDVKISGADIYNAKGDNNQNNL